MKTVGESIATEMGCARERCSWADSLSVEGRCVWTRIGSLSTPTQGSVAVEVAYRLRRGRL